MSTKFKDFTLEDPRGNIDLTIIDNEHFILEGLDFKKDGNQWKESNNTCSLLLEYHDSKYPKIQSCISITIDNKRLGYVRDVDADVLLPFYENKNNIKLGDALFFATNLRVNKDINGVAGVTIRINIKDIEITVDETKKKYTVITK